jgi:hypothetical protein
LADTETNIIDFWIALTGVAETGVWACVVGYLAIRFRTPISNVVASVSQRVERGDNVDIFGLKLEAVKASEELEADIESEVREVIGRYFSESNDASASELSEQIISGVRKQSFLTVDFTKVGRREARTVAYNQFDSVGLLLRYIWVEAEVFPVHSYARNWIIKNERTGEFLDEIGSRYARSKLGEKWDNRTLAQVGILAGDTITVLWKE